MAVAVDFQEDVVHNLHPIKLLCCHPLEDLIQPKFRSATWLTKCDIRIHTVRYNICVEKMSTHNMHEYGPLPSLQLNCTCEISTTQFRVVKLVSSAITCRWWFSVSVAATRTTYKAIHFFFANETTILSHHTVLTCGGPAFFVLALQLKPLLQLQVPNKNITIVVWSSK